MCLASGLFVIGGIYFLVVGSFLGAIAIYVGCGLAWLAHNKSLPALDQIMAPAIGIVLVWPLGVFNRIRKLKAPNRFIVYDAGRPGDDAVTAQRSFKSLGEFSSWKDAFAFAKEQAVKTSHRVSIHDQFRYKKTIIGTYMHRIYFVEPSGELTKLPF